MAPRRPCSTAMAPMAMRWTRISRTERLSLVDRGFVYAIAHIRGGTEKGFRWYREGKREKKINSFTDFIAVADFLVARGYAARSASSRRAFPPAAC